MRMGMVFSKRQKNHLPTEEGTLCLFLSEGLPEVGNTKQMILYSNSTWSNVFFRGFVFY
jgi:hypothetical protein